MPIDAAAEEQFGPYLVYERLGVGGMATVHRALEQGGEGFERVVALKRLLPHLAEDASFIKSFVREAKLASILNHVNIVQIYELGRVGTEYFISMEYIDGRDLRRILRHARKVTGPPPLHITVGLMIQLCDALDYAHNKVDADGHPLGLVHRDISPSNLLVTSAGHLKIIDFGIAKAQSSQLRTHTGRVKGKLAYMAPEAVSGSRDLDARSDIWAAGVIIHELLTARPLFASKNEYQTLLKVQRGDIMPPSTFNQACPPELDAIVFRALARKPDERYASAAELREALLSLKLQYALQTGYRDIAIWLDWAFGLEPPASFSANPDSSGVSAPQTPPNVRARTARPARNTDEEEAVEVVWGGGNVESEDGPVVLEDVPDVSQKHRLRRDTEDENQVDDIPTPPPSHGTMPSIYGSDSGAVPRPGSDPQVARGSEQMRSQRLSGPHTIPRAVTGPIPRTVTGTHPVPRSVTGPIPRTVTGTHPVPRTARTTSQGVVVTPTVKTGPVPLDVPAIEDRLAATRVQTEPERLSGEDLFSRDAAHALAQVEASMDAVSTRPGMPKVDDDEPTLEPTLDGTRRASSELPVVRFSRASTSPPLSKPAGLADPARPIPSTRPGVAPARAATVRAPSPSRPPADIRIGESIAARARPRRTWVYALLGLLLLGGAATGVTLLATRGDALPDDSATTPRAPVRETGTVKFVTEPEDAEIRIAGELAHAGSPWASELPAGVHAIEIRRTGYKSWLTSIELSSNETQTLRVVLEPLTAVAAAATLTITTTPAGLEVVIDGKVQDKHTPFKGTLEVGAHEISLRQNGEEVWQQKLTAEASSDYEFNPSFTADKKAERARRTPRASHAAMDDEVKGDHQDPSPAWIKPAGTHTPPEAPTAVPAVVAPADKPPGTTIAPPLTAGSAKPVPSVTQPPKPAAPVPAPPKPAITATAPAPARPAPPKLVPPKIVPPNAVKKLSGAAPSIEKFKNDELPSTLAAKVCIDTSGKVSFAQMASRVPSRVSSDLTEQLRAWRYAPYIQNGVAIPACFVVTFRAN